MDILKVSSKSNVGSVAGAMAGMIRDGKTNFELQAIGAGAVNQGVKAIATARGYLAPLGIELVCIPAFIELELEDERKTGIKFIIRKGE